MTETRCPTAEHLRACAEGRGEESLAEAVFRHADGCGPCRESLDALFRAGLGVGAAPSPDPACRRAVGLLAALAPHALTVDAPDGSASTDRRPRLEPRDGDTPPVPSLASTLDRVGTVSGHADGTAPTRPPTTGTAMPGRYVLGAELARGGMGVVHRATDTVFGREVAVKVLRHRHGAGLARRFDDEARITAQLQHPAIPPVHDLGTLPDGRPFLAMKLIKGDTLHELLAARPSPTHDRGRFLAAFESICQAVAYAHAHGVIHRDLKPQNVMVGNFGEVQVMAWGLARVLGNADLGMRSDDPDESALRTPRSDRTQAGSVLGTPAYMPPEQAIGAIDQIDRRSDVFGLGGILAAILTGKPPFVGETSEGTRQLAAKGKLEECLVCLAACQAEPELVALCVSCLKLEKEDRPPDADAVAKAVAGLRAAADERARQAEAERAKAEIRATEQRKRRRVQLGLAVAVGLVAVGGGVVAWWVDRQAREKRVTDLQRQLKDALQAAETADSVESQRRSASAAKAKPHELAPSPRPVK